MQLYYQAMSSQEENRSVEAASLINKNIYAEERWWEECGDGGEDGRWDAPLRPVVSVQGKARSRDTGRAEMTAAESVAHA